MLAPSRHERGFHAAFGIRPGDPMWLEARGRASIWRQKGIRENARNEMEQR